MNQDQTRRIRELMVELAVGQATAEEVHELEALLRAEPELEAELRDLQKTVALLQRTPALRPSPGFRASLERRLDRIDRAERRGALEQLRFRLHLFHYRVSSSSTLRWQLAAALVLLAVGLTLTVWQGKADPAPREVAQQPGPDEREPTALAIPAERSPDPAPPAESREDLVQYEPSFPEPDPPGPEVARSDPPPEGDPGAVELLATEGEGSDRDRAPGEIDLPQRDSRIPVRPGSDTGQLAGGGRGVKGGLRWLIRQQREDGSWSPGLGEADVSVGVTSLALMALRSAEEEAGDSLHQVQMRRAMDRAAAWLLTQQSADGCFGRTWDGATTAFNHSTACLALTERFVFGRGRYEGAAEEWARIGHGLDRLEVLLSRMCRGNGEGAGRSEPSARISGGTDDSLARCVGQNSAWASLALATARASGVDWGLRGSTPDQVDQVLARLRREQPVLLATHAVILAMQSDVVTSSEDARAWQRVVDSIMERPARSEPSLTFLVASALCPRGAEGRQTSSEWNGFRDRLESELLKRQDPAAGFFGRGSAWGWACFDGGEVYDTALALLSLQVPSRVERFAKAVSELRPQSPEGREPPR